MSLVLLTGQGEERLPQREALGVGILPLLFVNTRSYLITVRHVNFGKLSFKSRHMDKIKSRNVFSNNMYQSIRFSMLTKINKAAYNLKESFKCNHIILLREIELIIYMSLRRKSLRRLRKTQIH